MTWNRDPDLRRGRGLGAVLLAACAALLASASPAPAGPPAPLPTSQVKTDNITFQARVDPEKPLAGAKGVLVVELVIRKTVHVYADKRFKTTPVEAKGVTWGKSEVTEPLKWVDPALGGEPEEVWFDKATVKIPFELAADVAFPVQIAANFKWSCCDEGICYPPEATKNPVGFTLTASGVVAPDPVAKKDPAPSDAAMEDPAPAPPMADPPPPPPAMDDPVPPPAPKEPPPPPPTQDRRVVKLDAGDTATVTVSVTAGRVRAEFVPKPGLTLHAPGAPGTEPVRVTGKASAGATWKDAAYPFVDNYEITEPYVVEVAYEGTPTTTTPFSVDLHWQGCTEKNCLSIENETVAFDDARAWRVEKKEPAAKPPPLVEGAAGPSASPCSLPTVPATGLLFPEDGQASAEAAAELSWVESLWKTLGILILAPLFGTGVLLAFTPCVLPIIPITVSIIGGGSPDVTRRRLTVLLSVYVLGLSLAFGSLGVVSALTGSAISAAFQSPVALWVIAGIFVLLSIGMFGIYELQPPQWMQRMQGGAKGGSIVGAFLFGAMAAVIASPCTGPVIAGMLLLTAQTGSVLLGFLMFFSLGLGMGAVFFAAGSMNLLMRPGPWMVWVRYGFGVLLIGMSLFYLASAGRLVPPWLFVVGFGLALGIGAGIVYHLVKRQGEEMSAAGGKAAKVAVLMCLATLVVAIMTRPPGEMEWTSIHTRSQLVSEVCKANAEGKAVVIDVWATWCPKCVAYDGVIDKNPELKKAFLGLHRLRLDLSDGVDEENAIREGLGIRRGIQPYMVFIDTKGRIRRGLDVTGWYPDPTGALQQKVTELAKAKPAP